MNSGNEAVPDVLTYIIKAGQEVEGDDKEKMEVMVDQFATFFTAGNYKEYRSDDITKKFFAFLHFEYHTLVEHD